MRDIDAAAIVSPIVLAVSLPAGWRLEVHGDEPAESGWLVGPDGVRVAALPATEVRAFASHAGTGPRWRHKARGTSYTEVGRAELKQSVPVTLAEGDRLVVYRADADGSLGARAVAEFEDGRFERL